MHPIHGNLEGCDGFFGTQIILVLGALCYFHSIPQNWETCIQASVRVFDVNKNKVGGNASYEIYFAMSVPSTMFWNSNFEFLVTSAPLRR
jgi:hypothetical protein